MCLFKCITGLVSENPLAVNVLTSPKNSWNLHKSAFILLFHHSGPNRARKSYFQLDLRFQDYLLTRWLPTTSIFVVIGRIYRYQFKSNYLKNHRLFALHFLIISIYTKLSMFWKKNEPHISSISGVIESEVCAYLNV